MNIKKNKETIDDLIYTLTVQKNNSGEFVITDENKYNLINAITDKALPKMTKMKIPPKKAVPSPLKKAIPSSKSQPGYELVSSDQPRAAAPSYELATGSTQPTYELATGPKHHSYELATAPEASQTGYEQPVFVPPLKTRTGYEHISPNSPSNPSPYNRLNQPK